jgi:hypothetical protein
MIDGSHHPYEENVKLTKSVVDAAHAAGVTVEAELGQLGGIEEEVVGAADFEHNVEKYLTDPAQAADFWKRTGIDSLAVAIGTSHGAYKFKTEAKLAFHRVEQIMKTCPGLPLVMHGSSSVPKAEVERINAEQQRMIRGEDEPEPAPRGNVREVDRLPSGVIPHAQQMEKRDRELDPTCHPNGGWELEPGYSRRPKRTKDYEEQIAHAPGLDYVVRNPGENAVKFDGCAVWNPRHELLQRVRASAGG